MACIDYVSNGEKADVAVERQTQELWHKRLGHLSLNGMKQLREGMARGLDFSDQDTVIPRFTLPL
jgi:hypothetical protein